jgi:hypothetical protein
MTPDLFAFTVSAAAVAAIGRHMATTPAKTMRGKPVTFTVYDGEDVRTITPRGRDAWALGELIAAAGEGCTPIDNPGPRWSGYVHKLKRVYGLSVETITEMHGGDFAGKHARYVLRSRVAFADPADAAQHGGDQ